MIEFARITKAMRMNVADINRLEAKFPANRKLDRTRSFVHDLEASLERTVALASEDRDHLSATARNDAGQQTR